MNFGRTVTPGQFDGILYRDPALLQMPDMPDESCDAFDAAFLCFLGPLSQIVEQTKIELWQSNTTSRSIAEREQTTRGKPQADQEWNE